MTFEIPSDVKYIKCNVNQSGFYRVTYPEEMWTSIIATLCEAGELNATVPLRLSLYLLNERDYAPWTTALRYLHSWKERLSESPGYKRYISFFKKLLTPVTKYVGWSDEGSHLKK